MSGVFEAKVRKIGNARGVIIPKDILDRIHATEGEKIQLMIPITRTRRLEALRNLTGRYKEAKHFKREYEDRY
jgi:antitoxin component of MazEF toxin-antitoxin module